MQGVKQVIRIKINEGKQQKRRKDYSDRHTTDLVLDQRTRLLLFQLNQKGKLPVIEGLVNAGKEASVYRAKDIAVKVFATSNMIFKNRQIYIDGDRRFERLNSSSSNSRNLVRLWCEKEYRNLCRIYQTKLINVPAPLLQQENVIGMEMITNSARLVDVARFLTVKKLQKLYFSLLRGVRELYINCQLVHGDLSEFNILYQFHTKKLFLIDFGQAVDAVNENAMELLRLDLRNMNAFFAKLNVPTNSNLEIFQFVTTPIQNWSENQGSQIKDGENQAILTTLENHVFKVPINEVCDALTPQGRFVAPEVVAAIRALKARSRLIEYSEIRDDDAFVTIRANDQGADDNKIGLQLLGVDGDVQQFQKQKTRISVPAKPNFLYLHKKRNFNDENETVETPGTDNLEAKVVNSQQIDKETQNDEKFVQKDQSNDGGEDGQESETESDQNLQIDLHKLCRSDYDKETWKRITAELKERRRAVRQDEDRKSKAQKKREKTVAKKKRMGKK